MQRLSRLKKGLCVAIAAALPVWAAQADADLKKARDQQNLPVLDGIIARYKADADRSASSADAQYRAALAYSYAAEVAMEMRDKRKAERYAEQGLEIAKKATALSGSNAEYHRLLGALCGQVIPANPPAGRFELRKLCA